MLVGKDESGNVSHIKVKKREEGLGIGMEKVTDHAGNLGWGSTATTFDAVLQALKQAYRPDDDSSDVSDISDCYQALKGLVLQLR